MDIQLSLIMLDIIQVFINKKGIIFMFTDPIGDRMKGYENCYRIYLPKRSAVVVRVDGRAFHSFTKGFARPYDELLAHCMWETARKLCENVSGCKFGYTQSDEITLILTDYENINTEPWFGNNLQKIVSITASMATYFFNDEFRRAVHKEAFNESQSSVTEAHQKSITQKLCVFDSRAFIVPREEIFNVLYWRQLDCKRNSIQLLGQVHFSHNQLQGKNGNQIQEMLWREKGINWAKEPEWFKNGVSIYKQPTEIMFLNKYDNEDMVIRNKWIVDKNTPVFTQDHAFINKHFEFKE